jgi:glutamyl aminopeptidase
VKIEIPQSVTWIKVNYNQKGYYRVNYDEQNWKKLIELMKNNLTVRTAS